MREFSFHSLYNMMSNTITATMTTRHKNGLSPLHNSRSDNTTSGTSGSTESKMQGSYNWQRNNPPLSEVDMPALLQMRQLEECNAGKFQQCVKALGAQIIECNKSKYGKISTYRQRGKNILQKSKHTSLAFILLSCVVSAMICWYLFISSFYPPEALRLM